MNGVRPDDDTRADRELLAACRDGRDGFGVFYTRYRATVLAFCAQRVADAELAADLTAETFAAALLAVHDARRPLPDVPAAWLLAIAHRKLVDSYRRGTVRDDARRRLAMEPVVLYDEDIERIHSVADSTDVVATLAEVLSPHQLHAVRARVLDERPYADIAAELGCSQTVVRMRVSRALTVLRAVEVRHD
jgi:RNA polymerase sigma-70 factor (ECF subfamily)